MLRYPFYTFSSIYCVTVHRKNNLKIAFQSYKYFQNFTRHEILERLRLTPPMEEYARKGQVDPSFMQGGDHTLVYCYLGDGKVFSSYPIDVWTLLYWLSSSICVHSRRGDFIPSTIHAHATEDFVVPALKLLDKRGILFIDLKK